MFRHRDGEVEVFLVHPGGPDFAGKDDGFWGVPKGLIDPGETKLETALREFEEETGQAVGSCADEPELFELGSIVQRGGKRVFAWAFEGDWPEGAELSSNTFRMEWPRESGHWVEAPEIDRGQFFSLPEARRKINPAQEPFMDRLLRK